MALVTILTTTYNREKKLNDLFLSLQQQTNMDFEWFIVDDGSTDNTKECIRYFMEKAKFPIRYIKKENGGKHTALNIGLKNIFTPLTFIVDSDDKLEPRAVELISYYYKKYLEQIDKEAIGAFSYLKGNGENKPLVKAPKDEMIGSYVQIRIRGNRPGDMAEVFLTEVLKKFPFPEFVDEKFLSEDVVWIQIGLQYKYVFVNKIIYQCEYLTGGLTSNDKQMKFASPIGSMMRGKILMSKGCGLIAHIRGAIIYKCYQKEVKNSIPMCLNIEENYKKILCFVLKPLALYYNRKWKRGW